MFGSWRAVYPGLSFSVEEGSLDRRGDDTDPSESVPASIL